MYALYLLCFLLVGTYGKPWEQDEGNPLFDGNSDAAPEGEQSALLPSGPAPAQEFGAGPGEGGLDEASFPGGAQADGGSGFPQRSAGSNDEDKGDDAPPFNLGGKRGGASYNVFFPIQFKTRAHHRSVDDDDEGNPIFDGNSDAAPEGEQSALIPRGPAPAQESGAGPGEDGLDESLFPGGAPADAGSGGASYNVFFPIEFKTSRGRSHSANDDGTDSGSYNAIANSFATGRKGIATSHATALGGSSDTAARFPNFQQRPDQQAEA
nr:unnamed protein product [Callosobruchus chinensis]